MKQHITHLYKPIVGETWVFKRDEDNFQTYRIMSIDSKRKTCKLKLLTSTEYTDTALIGKEFAYHLLSLIAFMTNTCTIYDKLEKILNE